MFHISEGFIGSFLPVFLTTQLLFYNNDLWIGMNDVNWEMHFVWTDGKRISYTNWAKGHPTSGPRGHYFTDEVVTMATYTSIAFSPLTCSNTIK